MKKQKHDLNRLMKQASYASVTVALSLIIVKAATFFITGSVAILSGLFDSAQDFMTSGVNLFAVRHATEPADNNHRFGHGKAQAIGSLVQAFIIAIAALFLLIESIQRLFHPQELHQLGVGICVTLVAIAVTAVLLWFQSFVIRLTGSLSIKADRAHYTGDILMNVGIIVSMVATKYLGWTCLDSLFGVGVAGYLFTVVYQILRESFAMLMDTEMPEDFRKQIQAIAFSFPAVQSIHDMKTRQSGSLAFVQFCVVMHEDLTLKQAHDILDQIENKIKMRFPEAEVIIHAEPSQHRGTV